VKGNKAMGNISIMARRFSDGHVQYGWSGNGGYFSFTGAHLLEWYQNSDAVEYLFGLGQTACVGRVGSENGGCSIMETNAPTGRPFWLGDTEREIFSKINWIDYGYFYDLDHKWYYIIPGPFRIKLPLELVKNNLDKAGYEFEYRRKLEDELLKYILDEYRCTYSDFNEFIKKEDLIGKPLILPERMNVQSELANWFGKDFSKLQIAFTSNLGTNAGVMAANGLGYPISIEGAAKYWREDILVQRRISPEITTSTVIAWRRNIPYSLAVRKMIEEINAFQA
jgi:hypothetical protein